MKMKGRHGEKIDFRYNLREYWKVLGKYKGLFFLLLFVSLVAETLPVVEKFLFKRIIDDGARFIEGSLLADIFVKTLMVIVIIYLTARAVRIISKWFTHYFLAKLDIKIILDIKRKYFNHIVDLDHNFHTTHRTGSMVSRMIRGAGAVENMTDILTFNFIPLFINIVVVMFSLAYFSIVPAIVILLTTIVFTIYSYYILELQQKSKLDFIKAEDREKGMISDVFMNIDSVKYLGKEQLVKAQYEKKALKSKNTAWKYWGYFRWFDAGQSFILTLGTFFLIYFPIKEFLAGELSLGTLVFVYTVYSQIVGAMFGFVGGIRGFYRSMADFQDLFEYGKKENEIKDKPGAKNIDIQKGVIEFRDVSFSYGHRKLLKNFNLKIKENEKIALVGHSGSGKTTIVKLLNRFYDVDSGQILIDGRDLRDFKQESVRGETGIVPQECLLFDDTIYNNIKFAKPDASRSEVMNAIKLARLYDIVKAFPYKENTIVGERGVKLSGGEKQRVSIARAILANKKILVLDEATSSLDSETEHKIQEALSELLKGRTSIIIAHRLSTIMNADRIIVMKEGKIIQEGKHLDLIRRPGEYRKLWNLQKGGYLGD
jgi:ATP-binding cassette subfamily B protein